VARTEPPAGRPRRPWYRRLAWHALGAALLVALPFLFHFFFDYLRIRLPLRTSPLVAEAVDRANDHAAAASLLGRPIGAGWFVKGYSRQDETGWGEARLWIPVSGPKGEATLHARAGRGSGPWVFSALELLQGNRSVANLLEPDDPAAQVQLDPHQRPYLVRLGPPRSVSIDELPGYYRTRLGLGVETLPTLPLEAGIFDPRRSQHIAEELIAVMKRRLPRLAGDPTAVVIGITEADMYIRAYDWRFAFNYRGDERFAVISTARMTPWLYRLRGNEYLLHTRLRKMVSKNLALMVYRLPLSQDPTSLFYGGVMGVSDLDLIQERFEGLGTRAVVSDFTVSHRQALVAPVITPRPAPSPETGRYPCFLVRPATDAVAPGADVSAQIAECIPDMHADREADELEIDLRYGALVTRKTDLFVADSIPLALTRSYRVWDHRPRAFGLGTNHPYDTFPVGSRQPYTFIDVFLADGSPIHFDRISQGTGYADAVYEHTATSTRFFKSRFQWNGNG
jgi:hypothetical protein